MNVLGCRQHFPHFKSMGNCSTLKGEYNVTPNLAGIQSDLRFSYLAWFVTCKFDRDPIKNDSTILGTIFFPL